VPAQLAVVARLLNEGEESSAQDALELLIEVAEAHPRFLRRHLTEVASAMLQAGPAPPRRPQRRRRVLLRQRAVAMPWGQSGKRGAELSGPEPAARARSAVRVALPYIP